jgi:DNA-binding MarR family transcriptional regulator
MTSNNYKNADLSATIDKLIHEPARYYIMALLYVIDSMDFTFLQKQTEMTSGNLSTHLKKLKEAGYIKVTKKFVRNFPRTTLKLSNKGKRVFENYRERMLSVLQNLPKSEKSN